MIKVLIPIGEEGLFDGITWGSMRNPLGNTQCFYREPGMGSLLQTRRELEAKQTTLYQAATSGKYVYVEVFVKAYY